MGQLSNRLKKCEICLKLKDVVKFENNGKGPTCYDCEKEFAKSEYQDDLDDGCNWDF